MADVFDPNVFDPAIFDTEEPTALAFTDPVELDLSINPNFSMRVVTGAVAVATAVALTLSLPAPTIDSGGQIVITKSIQMALFIGGESALSGAVVSQGTNHPPGPMVFCLGQLFSDDERWVVVRRRFTMKGDGRVILTLERE